MKSLELGSVLLLIDATVLASIVAFGLVRHKPMLAPLLAWGGANLALFVVLASLAVWLRWSDTRRLRIEKPVA
jgi:hypothetical protein